MYTEEEEFNYDDYLDEDNNVKSNRPFIDWRYILKIILIILLVFLIIFLVFKIKNKNVSKTSTKIKTTEEEIALVFDNNMNSVQDAAYEYFFKDGNLPKNVGESKTISVKELISGKKITEVLDSKGNVCGYNTSGATITKNSNNYQLEVKVVCSDKSDTKIFYYDLDGKCLNCNGEEYNPEDNKVDDKTDDTTMNNDNSDADKVPSTEKACNDYSEWSTTYVAGNNYDRETRTLVRGYKEEITYGEWGLATTLVQTPSDTLDVKVFTGTDKVTTKTDWSSESTTKPSEKEGREIATRTGTKQYTTTNCTKDRTYTRTLTKWDNTAYSCKIIKLGKVECTYKIKGTCTTKASSKKVTYYRYRDTATSEVVNTYYQSRPITKNIVYTDYMLESELPEGYAKLEGSERVEYRYREKCSK